MLVNKQDSFYRSTHSDLLEFVAHSLKPCGNRRISFEQRFFCAEGVVCQWISSKQQQKHEKNFLSIEFRLKYFWKTYKLIVLFNVSDWLTGTFIEACGSVLLFGHPCPPIFVCCACAILSSFLLKSHFSEKILCFTRSELQKPQSCAILKLILTEFTFKFSLLFNAEFFLWKSIRTEAFHFTKLELGQFPLTTLASWVGTGQSEQWWSGLFWLKTLRFI